MATFPSRRGGRRCLETTQRRRDAAAQKHGSLLRIPPTEASALSKQIWQMFSRKTARIPPSGQPEAETTDEFHDRNLRPVRIIHRKSIDGAGFYRLISAQWRRQRRTELGAISRFELTCKSAGRSVAETEKVAHLFSLIRKCGAERTN